MLWLKHKIIFALRTFGKSAAKPTSTPSLTQGVCSRAYAAELFTRIIIKYNATAYALPHTPCCIRPTAYALPHTPYCLRSTAYALLRSIELFL